jgi:hypothetical protein
VEPWSTEGEKKIVEAIDNDHYYYTNVSLRLWIKPLPPTSLK